jgi:outer membrane protein OmpA-like peptidoglycan-associated protein
VDYFEIAADRLSTEGLGEARPIASNATPQGRRANRRVEVLILN